MYEVLSLGGSLVCPEKIDLNFLFKFKKFILKWAKKGKKFVIFVGGGSLAREYQKTAKKLGVLNNDDLDWLGIFATWLNASLLRVYFGKLAYKDILKNPKAKLKTKKKIIIFGGWKPGWSTDFDAVLLAKNLKAKRVINLSNIDFVFDKDPKKFKDAKPLKKLTFDKLLQITGKKWSPGKNLPFDPKATNLAKKSKIKIVILNGKNFENLDNFLKGKKFQGSVIE
jgi:uridylate kinase